MSHDSIVVREATADDRAAIRELTVRAYSEYADIMTPTAWKGLENAVNVAIASNESVRRFVAEEEDVIVGSVLLYAPGIDAYGGAIPGSVAPEFRLLAVAPEVRGRGIGRLLVDECIRHAELGGATQLGLHTSESLRVARGMYERMGFVRIPERDFHPDGAELILAYSLDLNRSSS